MPIKVACKCGQKFAAKDELAGKAVKCPKCKQPLRIPGGKQAPSKPAAPKQSPGNPQKPAAPQAPAGLAGGGGLDDLFSDLTVEQSVTGTGNVCPNCLEGIAQNAVICVHCGFRMDDGERLETEKGSEKLKRGHKKIGSFGNQQLDQAAKDIEKEKQDSETTDDQTSWWLYLMGLQGVAGIVGTALVAGGVGVGLAMIYFVTIVFNWQIYAIAGLIVLYVWWYTAYVAFKYEDNKIHGILTCIFGDIYALFFLSLRTTRYGSLFELCVAGWHIKLLAFLMAISFTFSGYLAVGFAVSDIMNPEMVSMDVDGEIDFDTLDSYENFIRMAYPYWQYAEVGYHGVPFSPFYLLFTSLVTVMGSIRIVLNWGVVATHAFEEEESIMHSVISTVWAAVFMAILGLVFLITSIMTDWIVVYVTLCLTLSLSGLWAIVYGIMRWKTLRLCVMRIIMGMLTILLPWGAALTWNLVGYLMGWK